MWKNQGLFKDMVLFQGLFQAHANQDMQYWVSLCSNDNIYGMATLETNPPKPFFENDELVVSLDLISP